jgi:hypothetical protein
MVGPGEVDEELEPEVKEECEAKYGEVVSVTYIFFIIIRDRFLFFVTFKNLVLLCRYIHR